MPRRTTDPDYIVSEPASRVYLSILGARKIDARIVRYIHSSKRQRRSCVDVHRDQGFVMEARPSGIAA
jgi:hypothetical protein